MRFQFNKKPENSETRHWEERSCERRASTFPGNRNCDVAKARTLPVSRTAEQSLLIFERPIFSKNTQSSCNLRRNIIIVSVQVELPRWAQVSSKWNGAIRSRNNSDPPVESDTPTLYRLCQHPGGSSQPRRHQPPLPPPAAPHDPGNTCSTITPFRRTTSGASVADYQYLSGEHLGIWDNNY